MRACRARSGTMDEDETTAETTADSRGSRGPAPARRAGPRPPIPQEDLDAITARRAPPGGSRSGGTPARPGAARPGPSRRPWRPRSPSPSASAGGGSPTRARVARTVPARRVARVEAVTGPSIESRAARRERSLRETRSRSGRCWTAPASPRPGLAEARGGATVRLDTDTRLRFASATVLDLERGAVYVDTGAGPGARSRCGPRWARCATWARSSPSGVDGEARRAARAGPRRRGRRGARRAAPDAARGAGAGPPPRRHRGAARDAPAYGPDWEWVLEAAAGFDIEGRTPRGSFLDWVSRETGWQVRFADAELAARRARSCSTAASASCGRTRRPSPCCPAPGSRAEVEAAR